MEIKDNGFVVTGASSGLGAATARMLVAQGGRVILADVNPQGEQLAAELGVNARFVVTDVTDPKSAQAAIDACLTTFGNLRGLVNCAGIAPGEKVVGKEGAHSLDTFARAININLIGSFNMLRLAATAMTEQPPLAENERGVIINTASIAAFEGQIGQAAYSASKGGVVAMTLPIARELARHGIRVMAIAPGVFETPMLMGLPENVREALGQSVPYPPRLGRPAEFAGLVQHIIGNLMLNGEVIRLDGAIRVQPR
ncbi:3-hydroxy-2-methylbutyryl-CoA dehydrogenase [Rugosibacter aromaticivorans]|uniref:3-hydroxy-2-methylbutyryl-CoA dehydrogenase n=1 Tax=Rugosibacter aromaticivorans TaxID=1565605 RepID=A0A0C5JA92_9PROT|nr:3-hydroxyacyl-CoA dehydrogenase [Rugosibacter aromaticivorans]AJP48860.1 3-hydroxy-2-methylbutyryl-CoA dehydrogenase [Rugosibacter aromaticivorans]ART37138.1 D99 [uncultured bacterium]TBR13654.1 MAG: 3-hydroxyacyl-CoA dehydrogenase [Rugosibacter sp.]